MLSQSIHARGGEIIHKDEQGRFIVIRDHGDRYYMYPDETKINSDSRLAELVEGSRSLNNSYKGSFDVWFSKMQKKRAATVKSYERQIEELKIKIESLKEDWGI